MRPCRVIGRRFAKCGLMPGRTRGQRQGTLFRCQFQKYLRMWGDRAEINANVAMLFANSFESEICLGAPDALGLGYGLPVGQALYAIDAFPDDDLLWRIEWIGGVGYNTSVPSEPQIDVCLAQLPKGEKNPLSARARSSQVEKRTVKIGVGLLPYVWIGSVWQKRRPVITNLSAYRGLARD